MSSRFCFLASVSRETSLPSIANAWKAISVINVIFCSKRGPGNGSLTLAAPLIGTSGAILAGTQYNLIYSKVEQKSLCDVRSLNSCVPAWRKHLTDNCVFFLQLYRATSRLQCISSTYRLLHRSLFDNNRFHNCKHGDIPLRKLQRYFRY